MKIESIIRRKHGTTVDMDGERYVFNAANGFICEVENERHAARLLAIKEGFCRPGQQPEPEELTPPPAVAEEAPEKPEADPLDSMTKAKLIAYIKDNDLPVDVEKGDTKNAILNRIKQAQHGNA